MAHQAGGQAQPVEPLGRLRAAQDRGRAGDVRVDAARGRDAHRPPAGIGGPAGGRDDDVVQVRPVAPPGAPQGARGGQAAVPDQHHLAGLDAGRAGVKAHVVGDPHPPAAVGRVTSHPEVAAQVDQDAAAHRGLDGGRGPVGGQRLGRGPQVEHDPGGDGDLAPVRVECDPAPAARGQRRLAQGACMLAGPREVLVVAEPDQRPPAGRIDVPVGERGGREGHTQRLREQRADPDRATVRVVDPPEFGVGPEPRAGRVHRVQFRGEQVMGRFQAVRMGDEQRRERPERPDGSRARRRGRGRHQPPACDELVTVGFGAGAELVDAAGAGAELGGASVGDDDELFDPPGEAEELDGLEELEGPGEPEPLPDGLAAAPGRAVGCAPGALFRPAG